MGGFCRLQTEIKRGVKKDANIINKYKAVRITVPKKKKNWVSTLIYNQPNKPYNLYTDALVIGTALQAPFHCQVNRARPLDARTHALAICAHLGACELRHAGTQMAF